MRIFSIAGLVRSLRRNHFPTRRQVLLVLVVCFLLSAYHRLPVQAYSIKDYFSHMRWEADLRSYYHVYGQKMSPLEREGLSSGWPVEYQQVVNVSSYAMKAAKFKGSKPRQLDQDNMSRRGSRDIDDLEDQENVMGANNGTEHGAFDDVTNRNNTRSMKGRRKKKRPGVASGVKVVDAGVVATVEPVGRDTLRSRDTEKLLRTFRPTVESN